MQGNPLANFFRKETVKKCLKFLAIEVVLAVIISVIGAPWAANWLCSDRFHTTFIGTVRDETRMDSTIENATVIIADFGQSITDSNGVFLIDKIKTDRPRYPSWGCQSCKDDTELEIKIRLPESDSIYVFQRKLDNESIGDTVRQTFAIRR